MTMNERRAEIMRILTARRSITMPELARTFQVTTRTIQNDVVALTVDYPLETQQGNHSAQVHCRASPVRNVQARGPGDGGCGGAPYRSAVGGRHP